MSDRDTYINQSDEEVIEHIRQSGGMSEVAFVCDLKLRDGAVIDREIVFTVQARWIDDAMRIVRVLVECDRPFSRKRLPATPCDVARDAHANRTIAGQVQKVEGFTRLDIRVAPIIQFALSDLHLPDDAVTVVADDRFQKADFQRRPEIEDAKAAVCNPPTRIAEAGWVFPEPEWVRERLSVNAAELRSCGDNLDLESNAGEGRRWRKARH